MKIQPYWTIEIYGRGGLIREFTQYPNYLPICVYSNHGWAYGGVAQHELNSDAPIQLYQSERHIREWKKRSTKPVYQYRSPLVEYRRRYVTASEFSNGTVAFPVHSTPSIEDELEWEDYGRALLSLPETFQPVTACVHIHDIKNGRYKALEAVGVPVVTAGDSLDKRFPERFYDILRRFKYSTSNGVGTYSLYSVEMGIPFFVYGPEQRYINRADSNIPIGIHDPKELYETYRKAYDLFTYTNIEEVAISADQTDFCERELGLRDGLPWNRLRRVLFRALIQWSFSLRPLWFLWSRIKRRFQ